MSISKLSSTYFEKRDKFDTYYGEAIAYLINDKLNRSFQLMEKRGNVVASSSALNEAKKVFKVLESISDDKTRNLALKMMAPEKNIERIALNLMEDDELFKKEEINVYSTFSTHGRFIFPFKDKNPPLIEEFRSYINGLLNLHTIITDQNVTVDKQSNVLSSHTNSIEYLSFSRESPSGFISAEIASFKKEDAKVAFKYLLDKMQDKKTLPASLRGANLSIKLNPLSWFEVQCFIEYKPRRNRLLDDPDFELEKIEDTSEEITDDILQALHQFKSPLTIDEVGNVLRVRPNTIYGFINKRSIKGEKKGKRLFFSVEEVENFVKNHHYTGKIWKKQV